MTPDQSSAPLFIFMVVTPLLRPGEVELGLAANPEKMSENPNQYRISLSAGRLLEFRSEAIPSRSRPLSSRR